MNTNNTAYRKLSAVWALLFLIPGFSVAQTTSSFQKTDTYVKSLGNLDTLNMGTIANILTKNFSDKVDKTRAIFTWIATYIAYETNTGKANNSKNNSTEAVLKNRKATGLGYATLFQDMCSIANVRCLTVDGYLKKSTDDITEANAEINHTWNVVQLGQSPDTWYYVDPTLASGWVDKKAKIFYPAFDDSYFFANKNIFNLQHYPDNTHWQLGKGPKNLSSFNTLPIIKNGAYHFALGSMVPRIGLIKTTAGKAVNFNFSITEPKEPITTVALKIEVNKRSKIISINNFSTNNTSLEFNYSFDTEGEFAVTVVINDLECLQYLAEVE